MRRIALLLPFALAACGDPPPPAVTQTPAAQPAPVTPAAPPPPAALPQGKSSFAGYGDTRFGMDAAAFRSAYGATLSGGEGLDACGFLWPSSASANDLGFMFSDGKFVRYSSSVAAEGAPGGGRVGMQEGQIFALYPARVEKQKHKYVENGSYLRIKSDANDGGVLIFETDEQGLVTMWRVGVEPQIDQVEGCG